MSLKDWNARCTPADPKEAARVEQLTRDLIAGAALAEEIFSPDELEDYARHPNKPRFTHAD